MEGNLHRSTAPAPSLGTALGRTFDLAQQVATDELRLLQLESHERGRDALRRGAWIAFGGVCLLVAWLGASAAAVVALEGRFSLEARLAMLAGSQFLLGVALVIYGSRRREDSR